jgi:hypothetical protein
MPLIEVPRRYRLPTSGLAKISASGATVEECIRFADAQYPGFGELVLDGDGELRRFVTLFVNGKLLEREGLNLPLQPTDTITIVAAAAGG